MRKRWYRHPPNVRVPSGLQLGYLAGLIDGEGHLSDHRNLRIDLTNTSTELLNWLVDVVGGKIYKQRKRTERWKATADWIVTGSNARVVLEAVAPHLTAKKERAAQLLEGSLSVPEGLKRRPH